MRFPLALTAKIAGHIIKHKMARTPKFAMVLQLEPLHTCNLTCTGCGRIREYSTSLKDMMPLEDCLESAVECDAPMVSICGGEPLIYPKIEELVDGLRKQGRIVYICTNGMFMRKKMKDYLASIYSSQIEPKLKRLLNEKLITEKDADHESNIYEAVMPYMMRLTNDGIAIHGSVVEYGKASRGCVGVPDEFAARLFAQARLGDRVRIVQGSPTATVSTAS